MYRDEAMWLCRLDVREEREECLSQQRIRNAAMNACPVQMPAWRSAMAQIRTLVDASACMCALIYDICDGSAGK